LSIAEAKARRKQRPRAGTQAIALLTSSINVAVLQALAEGPKSLMSLLRAAGAPSQSTLRLRLRELTDLGVLIRGRQEGFPRALDYKLAPPGHELLSVMDILGTWLAASPSEPIALGSPPAKGTIKALVEGWDSTLVRALAAKPLTLTELDRLITAHNYPSLERRLGAMRRADLIEPLPSRMPGTPYTATGWLRRGVAPLTSANRWERLHAAEATAPVGRLDVEAAFLLAIPLLELPPRLSGSCRLAVATRGGGEQRLAGVTVEVEEGQVVSYVTTLDGNADAWVAGTYPAWLGAVIEHDQAGLEIGGDSRLAGELVGGMHGVLFAPTPG
jgi:DNA-binding HxlR family transcriptional regulator